jgi:predicted PurR-regulated permease PerM
MASPRPSPPSTPASRAAARRAQSPGWRSRDILRAAALVMGLWLALQFFWAARSVLVLTFLGVLFGVALSGGVTGLERRRVPRGVGALLLVLAVYGSFVGLGALAAPRITEQVGQLQEQLPSAIDRIETWVREHQSGVTRALQPNEVKGNGGKDDPQQGNAEPAAESPDLRDTLTQQLAKLGSNFFAFFRSTLALLGGLLVVTVVAVYIAVDPRTYRRGILHLVPHRARPKAIEVMNAMGVTLRRWLVAQLIAMLVVGVVTTLALLLIGVRAAVALGIIAGILEFVPYVGPILSAVPAVAMAFLDGPEKALWVLGAYVAIQQLENHILIPLLMKEGLELPPVITIVGQMALSLVFGFVGLLIAVPLMGAVMVPIKLLYVQDVVGDEVPVVGTG